MVGSTHNIPICLQLSQHLPVGTDKNLKQSQDGWQPASIQIMYLMNTPVIITATYLLLQLYSLSHKYNTVLWCLCCRHRGSWFQWFKIFSRRPNFFVMMGKKSITILIIFTTSEKTSENKKNRNNKNKLHYCSSSWNQQFVPRGMNQTSGEHSFG